MNKHLGLRSAAVPNQALACSVSVLRQPLAAAQIGLLMRMSCKDTVHLALQERLQQQLQRRENVLKCFQAAHAATEATTGAAEAVLAAHGCAAQVSKSTSLHTESWLLTLPLEAGLHASASLVTWLCQDRRKRAGGSSEILILL